MSKVIHVNHLTSEGNQDMAAEEVQAPALEHQQEMVRPKAAGGKQKWDNEALDPNRRKSIAEDPDGKANARLAKKK